MKYQNAILSDIAKAVTVLLICIIAYQGFSQCEAGSVCEAREGKEEKEIEEYIREYYKGSISQTRTSWRKRRFV